LRSKTQRIREYLTLQLDTAELPLNHLLGDVLFPPSLVERLPSVDVDGRTVVAPPYAKIGGAQRRGVPLVDADGVEYVPFYEQRQRRPDRSGPPYDAKGKKNSSKRGGCNENEILMKCRMDLRQFGLDEGGGFWLNMEPLCLDAARRPLEECSARRAWIAAPQNKDTPFTAQEVRVQVQRALWALQTLDPRVRDRMGEIYSVERRPGEKIWYPTFLSES